MFGVIIGTVCLLSRHGCQSLVLVTPDPQTQSCWAFPTNCSVCLISLILLSAMSSLPNYRFLLMELSKSLRLAPFRHSSQSQFYKCQNVTFYPLTLTGRSNFLTSFLSIFTFKTNIMIMIQSIIIVKIKRNSLTLITYFTSASYFALGKKNQSQKKL